MAAVPVDEYLITSYQPDVEYVDGVLVEKGTFTVFHQLLSAMLLAWRCPVARIFRLTREPFSGR